MTGPRPFRTLILGGYGADVIHVSRIGKVRPTTGGSHHNCDKRSIRLEGFRPGVMKRLRLGPEALMKDNPADLRSNIRPA